MVTILKKQKKANNIRHELTTTMTNKRNYQIKTLVALRNERISLSGDFQLMSHYEEHNFFSSK